MVMRREVSGDGGVDADADGAGDADGGDGDGGGDGGGDLLSHSAPSSVRRHSAPVTGGRGE